MVEHLGNFPSLHRRDEHGLKHVANAYWNASPAQLCEHAVLRGEGILTAAGPFATVTKPHTGRSPKDKFLVREATSEANIWWGETNQPIERKNFETLYDRMVAHLKGQDVFISDLYVCTHEDYQMNVRVISENAWQNLFARNMFLRPAVSVLGSLIPDFTILHIPTFQANPQIDGTNSEMFVVISLERKLVLIGGSRYAGEIKKSIFTILNYLLPAQDVLTMHCSANVGPDKDTALFFGLSGTGKTTLSADPGRRLIGDDEHGWCHDGVFNFEGGSYAKVISLSREGEPDIYNATHRFGTILENVVIDEVSRRIDLDDNSLTENTRASFPIEYMRNALIPGVGGHPENIFFLSADAFGVLPPIARLTNNQAMYYFLAGYTAKVGGTERGVDQPQATFSACFGEPFLPLHPSVYAAMLSERIQKHGTRVWLVNTGWTGGPYGIGHRMKLAHTRAMIRAALDGDLDDVPTEKDPFFGLSVPRKCSNVPDNLLMPRNTWADKNAYDQQARKLAEMFVEHFAAFEEYVESEVLAAAPGA